MKKERSRLSSLLPLAVFALMALCLMGVLLTGAGVFRRIGRSGEESSRSRTAALYLSTRVRQAESVRIETFGDCQALVFSGEEEFVTRVYCHEGRLRELFSEKDALLAPEDGEVLLELETLEMAMEENLLRLDTGDHRLVFAIPAQRRAGE